MNMMTERTLAQADTPLIVVMERLIASHSYWYVKTAVHDAHEALMMAKCA